MERLVVKAAEGAAVLEVLAHWPVHPARHQCPEKTKSGVDDLHPA